MKPMFIVLEALDGVGKTTLARALARHIGGVFMNTPGDQLRGIAGDVLEGLGPNQQARCIFYAASVVARGAESRLLVESGVPVVMDRYWLSTISYARARGVTDALNDLEAMVTAPDLTVLLVLDESTRQARMASRGTTVADRETMVAAFRDRVHAEMVSPHRREQLRPTIELDLTGLDPQESLSALLTAIQSLADEEVAGGMDSVQQ